MILLQANDKGCKYTINNLFTDTDIKLGTFYLHKSNYTGSCWCTLIQSVTAWIFSIFKHTGEVGKLIFFFLLMFFQKC